MNENKFYIPPFFSQLDVLTSSIDKTDCFVRMFSANLLLIYLEHPLDFQLRTVSVEGYVYNSLYGFHHLYFASPPPKCEPDGILCSI